MLSVMTIQHPLCLVLNKYTVGFFQSFYDKLFKTGQKLMKTHHCALQKVSYIDKKATKCIGYLKKLLTCDFTFLKKGKKNTNSFSQFKDNEIFQILKN